MLINHVRCLRVWANHCKTLCLPDLEDPGRPVPLRLSRGFSQTMACPWLGVPARRRVTAARTTGRPPKEARMGGRRGPRFLTLAMAGSVLCVLGAVASAAQPAGAAAPAAGALVSVGSPTSSHPRNSQ